MEVGLVRLLDFHGFFRQFFFFRRAASLVPKSSKRSLSVARARNTRMFVGSSFLSLVDARTATACVVKLAIARIEFSKSLSS